MPRQFHAPYSLLPEATATLNLGKDDLRWLEAFLSNLNVSTRATVPTPVNATDAATKGYVDGLFVPTVAVVENAEQSVQISRPTTIRLDQADGLVLTNPSPGVARIDLSAIPNAALANSSVTVTAGGGLSGGGAVALGAAVTVSLSTHTHEAGGTAGGTISAAAITAGALAAARGGTAIDTSGSTGVPSIAAGVWSVLSPLTIARGGTNSTTALSNNRIVVSSAGALVEAAAMTNGQLLIGSTGAAPVVAALTAGTNITITNAAGAITIAASGGVQTGDSPTWTGTHTWSSAGARILMSNADSQIILAGAADPGWTLSGIQVGAQGSVFQDGSTQTTIGQNVYNDAANRYIATAVAARVRLTGRTTEIGTALSGTAGTVISFTTSATFFDGLQMGAPTGGDKGAGTINVATDIYKNNTAYTNPAFVFEHYYTGGINRFLEQYRKLFFDFQSNQWVVAPGDWRLQSLEEIEAYTRAHCELPNMALLPKRGLFDRGELLLASVEGLYLHMFALNNRIKTLEATHAQ